MIERRAHADLFGEFSQRQQLFEIRVTESDADGNFSSRKNFGSKVQPFKVQGSDSESSISFARTFNP